MYTKYIHNTSNTTKFYTFNITEMTDITQEPL